MRVINWIALILVIIGALNWGMIGFFKIDVVASIFGGQEAVLSRIIYALVGLAGLWSISFFRWLCCCHPSDGQACGCNCHKDGHDMDKSCCNHKDRNNGNISH